MMITPKPKFDNLHGVSALVQDYDVFILDLWGVVHDGVVVYPHAVEALRQLRIANKQVVFLSNAPRLVCDLIDSMQRMGLPRLLYNDILSSGEIVNLEIQKKTDPFYANLGQFCWHLGPNRDRSIFMFLDIKQVDSPEDATFVINTGPRELNETILDYEPQLQECLRNDLPMICANPDQAVLSNGQKIICAGAIAAFYETLGGRVSYRGKPDPSVYDLCLERLAYPPKSDRRRVIAIGDTLETDIAGATAAGIDSVLITSGIHGDSLQVRYNEQADPTMVAALLDRYHLDCRAILPAFVW